MPNPYAPAFTGYNPYATPANPYAPNPMAFSPQPYNQPNTMNGVSSPVAQPTNGMMGVSNTPTQNGPFVLVNGVQGAREVMVQPNQTIYMMSQNSNEFYVKSADNMGVANLRFFRFNEFDPNTEVKQPEVQQTPQIDVSQLNFVTRDEVEDIIASRFEAFGKNISQTTKQTVMKPKKETRDDD